MELVIEILAILVGFPIFLICLIVYAIKSHIAQQQLEDELRQKHEDELRKAYYAKLEENKLKREEEARQAAIDAQKQEAIRLFHLNTFPVTVSDEKIASIWNDQYPCSMHNETDMIKNQVCALYQTIPLLIDPEHLTALFGNYNEYLDNRFEVFRTDLTSCSCPYHYSHKGPCAHTYRLFFELTHKPNLNAAIVDSDGTITAEISKLSDYDLRDFIPTALSLSRQAVYDTFYKKYLSIGLLTIVPPSDDDYRRMLNKMTKDQIILALRKYGASGFYQSWTKFRLVTWIIETQKAFLQKRYTDYGIISVNPILKPWLDGVRLSKKSYRHVLPDELPNSEFNPYDPYA